MTMLTVIALSVSWEWGLMIFRWPAVIMVGTYESNAAIIRRAVPIHLINPDQLHLGAGRLAGLQTWMQAETNARLAVIWCVWASLIILVAIATRQGANISSERVRVGRRIAQAGRSA